MMAKGVHVGSDGAANAQFLLKVRLTIKPLAHKGFSARQVAVRLHPPTAHDLPAPFLYAAANLLKQLGIHPLYVGKEGR